MTEVLLTATVEESRTFGANHNGRLPDGGLAVSVLQTRWLEGRYITGWRATERALEHPDADRAIAMLERSVLKTAGRTR